MVVDQEELLFGPHPQRLRLDHAAIEHQLQGAQVVQQGLHVVLAPVFS